MREKGRADKRVSRTKKGRKKIITYRKQARLRVFSWKNENNSLARSNERNGLARLEKYDRSFYFNFKDVSPVPCGLKLVDFYSIVEELGSDG